MPEENTPALGTARITSMSNSSNNNNLHHHNYRKKKRIYAKQQQQQRQSPSLTSKYQHISSMMIINERQLHMQSEQAYHRSMKTPLSWTKKWTKWFALCGSEQFCPVNNNSSHTRTVSNHVSRQLLILLNICYFLFDR